MQITIFFVTNHTLSACVAEEIENKLINVGVKNVKVYGSEWITSLILSNPKLRRLVPRLYGLGDLTQIVTHQAYRQAREVLDSIAPDLASFVPTEAYRKCAHSLQEHGFVLLLGEPASGKTMIANLMALSAADEWNLQTLIISSPDDFSRLWNPDDPGQFLWIDDAFGATQYDSSSVIGWNQQLPKLKAAIKVGARVVFTSRDYIFAAAKNDLKIHAFELLDDSRVVIQVEHLTEAERQMILYNHLKSGSQSIEFKSAVKLYLHHAVMVSKFLPEIARRFGNPKFTQRLSISAQGVKNFFECPVKVLSDVVASLASPEKAAIALVFISGGKLPIPVYADENISITLDLLGVTLGQVKSALISLDDSLLKRIIDGGREYWIFRHPTIRDAYASLVGENPELISVYLAGVTTGQLLSEVACGETNLQGVKIFVPPEFYSHVIDRLGCFVPPQFRWVDPVESFLSNRCSAEFLSSYYKENKILSSLPSGIYHIGSSDAKLRILKKLKVAGYLTDEVSNETVRRVIALCERDYSCHSIEDSSIDGLLTEHEKKISIDRIVDNLLTNGSYIIEEIYQDWNNEDDPHLVFYDIENSIEFIGADERFSEDQKKSAVYLSNDIHSLIAEMKAEMIETTYNSMDTEDAIEAEQCSFRSIFDDVDE